MEDGADMFGGALCMYWMYGDGILGGEVAMGDRLTADCKASLYQSARVLCC